MDELTAFFFAVALVEIAEEAGEEQCFLFGHLTPDVDHVRYLNRYQAMPLNERSPELAKVFKAIRDGMFGPGDGNYYGPLLDTVEHVDHVSFFKSCFARMPLARNKMKRSADDTSSCQYLVANDFESYLRAEALADELFTNDHEEWIRRTMLTTARMGKFSSDRAVQTYADEVSRAGTLFLLIKCVMRVS